jgi:hypothetical protein
MADLLPAAKFVQTLPYAADPLPDKFRAVRGSDVSLQGSFTYQEIRMAKGSSNGGRSGNGQGKSSGASRPGTGFPGGNWPSTTGNPSGGNRGNAPTKRK